MDYLNDLRAHHGLGPYAGRPLDVPTASRMIGELGGTTRQGLTLIHLHPWVANSARGLWSNGHYRQAVDEVARSVNHRTQEKLGRYDVTEADLFNQAFSKDQAQFGMPRLRPTGNRGTRTYENRLRGARALAEACYAGVRNVSAHEDRLEWTWEEALHYLTMFSVLARWVDQSDVDRASK